MDRVVSAGAYSKYEFRPADANPIVRHNTPISSSAGKIRVTAIYPAPGLKVVTGPSGEVEKIDQELAKELGVDAVLRAHFRVGVYQGRASVEMGSVFYISSSDVSGELESRRSLASDQSVLRNYGYTPTISGIYDVSEEIYLEAINNLFQNYAALATEALK